MQGLYEYKYQDIGQGVDEKGLGKKLQLSNYRLILQTTLPIALIKTDHSCSL